MGCDGEFWGLGVIGLEQSGLREWILDCEIIGIGSAVPRVFLQRYFGLWAKNAETYDRSSTRVRSSSRRISLWAQWAETMSSGKTACGAVSSAGIHSRMAGQLALPEF